MKKPKFTTFDVIVYSAVALFTILTIYPFFNILAVSMSDYGAYLKNPLMIIPKDLDFNAYRVVFTHHLVLSSYKNTVIITIVGTCISMFLTITMAYSLSRNNFKAKPLFIYMLVFTMLFNGGLIPNFYLIKTLGLLDKLWALILPGALSAYNVILMKNFFESIPDSMEEAARIDGASDLYILTKIILPLSMPIIATLTLFYAVGRWNTFFSAIVYIRDRGKWTLQLLLREVVMSANAMLQDNADPTAGNAIPLQNIKYATIVVAIIPIMSVYPFLQKYFIKGIMLGAVKQ